jgi:ABC-type xylose transport system permease subunit
MASVMSNEPDHRAALSTFRGVGSMIPQILVGVVVPMFLYTTLEDGTKIANASAFPVVALIMSVLAVVCYVACYFMCTERVEVAVYALSGFLAGLAGITIASRLYAGTCTSGDGAENDAIAAVVIGGTSMAGGSGKLGGTLIGALIIGLLNNGLNLMGVNSDWQFIIKGGVILGAVYMDFIRSQKKAK